MIIESNCLLLLFLLLHNSSSLHVAIDGDEGNNTNCTQDLQLPCQSLKYVADTVSFTSNLTIEIKSPTLNLSGSIVFNEINGLTINGQGASITCVRGFGKDSNGSGIVFHNCHNIHLNSFTIEYCGLIYEHHMKVFLAALLCYNCRSNIELLQINLSNSDGTGIVLYDVKGFIAISGCSFSNNSMKPVGYQGTKDIRFNGGGLHVMNINGTLLMSDCIFVGNSATRVGGAIHFEFSLNSVIHMHFALCNFTGNRADRGGAISIVLNGDTNSSSTAGYHINIYSCNIIDNKAQFGGGVALEESYTGISHAASNTIRFHSCTFSSNKAKMSSAVDINGRNKKKSSFQISNTIISFGMNCYFRNNVAGVKVGGMGEYRGQSYKATVFVIDVQIYFMEHVSFINNTGTALYVVNGHVYFHTSFVSFTNNTGDLGGAIMLSDDSIIHLTNNSNLTFINNTAVVGGAIYCQSIVIIQYNGLCFIQNAGPTVSFQFTNNTATSKIGHDIFVSTLGPCVQQYSRDGSPESCFKDGKMGRFISITPHSVATAPLKLLETSIAPYPGLPYTMNITQEDEFGNIVTNLELFPISATLLHNHSSSMKINQAYSIANNYTILFNGEIGDSNNLSLQTTEYSAALNISVILRECPPGYIFQADTCHCSHSTSLYYYGILHCVEDKRAVIAEGLWAGYMEGKFVTANCARTLCGYYESKRNNKHVLPLDPSLLSDSVCAPHRAGTLCGSCTTSYTTFFHSPTYQCGESTLCQYGPLFYILSEIIPVTGIFLTILFFNINLTSGALYSFIFFAQIVVNHYGNTLYQSYSPPLMYIFSVVRMIYGIFDLDILEIDQFSFCLFENATIMDLMLVKYLTTLYALFLIIVTILILRFNVFYSCIKLCHKCGRRNIKGSIVNALTAFLVLCYFRCLVITLHILVPSYLMGVGAQILKMVPLYNGELSYMSGSHLKYVIPAVICLTVIILPPPIILLSEPLLVKVSGVLNIRRNAVTYTLHRLRMKLKPFLDSFQGSFKDSCRCFAGLFFLYRILLVLIPSMLVGGNGIVTDATKGALLFIILLLHSICRPFVKDTHNKIDSFLLIILLLINLVIITDYSFVGDSDYTNRLSVRVNTIAAFLLLFHVLIPLLYLLCYTCRCCLVKKKSSVQSLDDDDSLPARLLVSQNYNTFNN